VAARVTETHVGTVSGALVGLVQWAISTYAFGGNEPPAVTAAVFIVLPAVFGGVASFFTRRSSKQPEPPSADPGPAATAASPGG
jgi:hypothetical protein